ncbi:MAG: anti-sigma factor [Pseudolabrys sp.]|nr:anti-sigma factor [Pseudolabrys sp.]
MTCDEASVLVHALIDGELDASHAREVEAHIAGCAACAKLFEDFSAQRATLRSPALRFAAPAHLRKKIDSVIPSGRAASRRDLLKGFAGGAALSAIAASGLTLLVLRDGDERRVTAEIVSAHLRSLQADHLTDVQSTDQHTVKPWFNGRLDAAPPVIDLTAQGFTLIGGRLDYIDAKPVAALVYRRRTHVINLFAAPDAAGKIGATMTSINGFHVRRWRDDGFSFWAVSDLEADELAEFGSKIEAALRA